MNKKMNYLAAIPIYGSVIIMFWLFIKTVKKEINMKQLSAYLLSSALIGFFSILVSVLFFKFIGTFFGNSNFINNYGVILGLVLGGYLMNLFTFAMVNKRI